MLTANQKAHLIDAAKGNEADRIIVDLVLDLVSRVDALEGNTDKADKPAAPKSHKKKA